MYLIGEILSILEIGLEYHEHMKQVLPIGLQLLRVSVLAIFVIVLILIYFPKTRPPILREYRPIETQSPTNNLPLNSLYVFEIRGNRYEVLIEPERIFFQPFEGTSDLPSLTLTKEEYPKLFEQGVAKASFHSVILVGEGKNTLLEVSNNQPDHGSYSPTLTVLVDPHTAKVTVKQPQSL